MIFKSILLDEQVRHGFPPEPGREEYVRRRFETRDPHVQVLDGDRLLVLLLCIGRMCAEDTSSWLVPGGAQTKKGSSVWLQRVLQALLSQIISRGACSEKAQPFQDVCFLW